jgi:hypothetical protein
LGSPDSGGQTNILRFKPPPLPQHNIVLADILAGATVVRTRFYAGHDDHVVAVLAAVLLHHHRVRPLWHRRAGENADCLAAHRRPTQRVPRRHPAGNRQARFTVRVQVVEEHRIAVDRRIVMRRYADRGRHIFSQQSPAGLDQR